MKKMADPHPEHEESRPEFPGGIGSPAQSGHVHWPKPYNRLLDIGPTGTQGLAVMGA
jgi:hypothetical protein